MIPSKTFHKTFINDGKNFIHEIPDSRSASAILFSMSPGDTVIFETMAQKAGVCRDSISKSVRHQDAGISGSPSYIISPARHERLHRQSPAFASILLRHDWWWYTQVWADQHGRRRRPRHAWVQSNHPSPALPAGARLHFLTPRYTGKNMFMRPAACIQTIMGFVNHWTDHHPAQTGATRMHPGIPREYPVQGIIPETLLASDKSEWFFGLFSGPSGG